MKTAKQLKITPTQFKNLAKLTMFVRDKAEPPRFDINAFFSDKNGNHFSHHTCPSIEEYECGTTACFLGYGIPAGIKARKEEDWSEYCKRAFGIRMTCDWRAGLTTDVYDFLFKESHVNSKDAAALRGAWLLMNGLPCDGDGIVVALLDYWEAPADFKPDWSVIEAIANQ